MSQAEREDALEMFTIYDRPNDYPRDYVVRRWRVVRGERGKSVV